MISPPPINGEVVGPDKRFANWWINWIGALFSYLLAPEIPLKAVSSPVLNGGMTFELTDNTHITIHARGSDGVVRSVSLVIA